MNNWKKFWILPALLAIMIMGCGDPVSPNPSGESGSGDPSVINRSTKAYDGNNNFLGYCAAIGSNGVTIFSSNSYFYTISWNGEFFPGSCYSTEIDMSGILFTISTYIMYGKTILFINNILYTYDSLDQYGNTVSNDSITNYKYGNGMNYPASPSIPASYKAYVLKPITRSEAGIPATIPLPIKIKYE